MFVFYMPMIDRYFLLYTHNRTDRCRYSRMLRMRGTQTPPLVEKYFVNIVQNLDTNKQNATCSIEPLFSTLQNTKSFRVYISWPAPANRRSTIHGCAWLINVMIWYSNFNLNQWNMPWTTNQCWPRILRLIYAWNSWVTWPVLLFKFFFPFLWNKAKIKLNEK